MADRGEAGVQPIDEFLGLDTQKENYGIAFDRAAGYLRDVLMKMGGEIGWKSKERPFDFDGFSGYYPEIHKDHADICQGDYVVARFSSRPDGRLGFESFGEEFDQYPEDVNPWYPLADVMNGKYCLDPANLERAREECHRGQEIIYGIRHGEACAFGIDADDRNLRTKLADMEANVRFVAPDAFIKAMEAWLERDGKPGFESAVQPEMVMYIYDGNDVRDERAVSLNLDRLEGQGWGSDWLLIDALRDKGEEIRTELERAAGIPEGRHFKFGDAIFPSTNLRNDALFLSKNYNGFSDDFITVANGQVALYRGYDPAKRLSDPKARYASVDDAVKAVRKVCLSERNIAAAKKEFQGYLQSRTQGRAEKKGGPKI